MMIKSKRKNVYFPCAAKNLLTLALAGSLAGLCNGLLGAGGGVVLVLFLSKMIKKDEEAQRSVYANALCVMLPLSFLTLMRYGGPIPFSELRLAPEFVLGAALGGLLGGIILGKLSKRLTGRLFAVLTVVSGILMLVR
jgi:uncharacterized membrane protein YfcA